MVVQHFPVAFLGPKCISFLLLFLSMKSFGKLHWVKTFVLLSLPEILSFFIPCPASISRASNFFSGWVCQKMFPSLLHVDRGKLRSCSVTACPSNLTWSRLVLVAFWYCQHWKQICLNCMAEKSGIFSLSHKEPYPRKGGFQKTWVSLSKMPLPCYIATLKAFRSYRCWHSHLMSAW